MERQDQNHLPSSSQVTGDICACEISCLFMHVHDTIQESWKMTAFDAVTWQHNQSASVSFTDQWAESCSTALSTTAINMEEQIFLAVCDFPILYNSGNDYRDVVAGTCCCCQNELFRSNLAKGSDSSYFCPFSATKCIGNVIIPSIFIANQAISDQHWNSARYRWLLVFIVLRLSLSFTSVTINFGCRLSD